MSSAPGLSSSRPDFLASAIRPFEIPNEKPRREDHRPRHGPARCRGRGPLELVMGEFHGRHQQPRVLPRTASSRSGKHLLTDEPVSENRRLLDRGVLHAGVLRSNRRPCSTRRWSGIPTSPALPGGLEAIHPQPAGHGRGAHLVDHVPHRHDRRREPHPLDEPTRLRHRAGPGAQLRVREGAVPPQAGRARHQRRSRTGRCGALDDEFTLDELDAARSRTCCGSNRARQHEFEPSPTTMLGWRRRTTRSRSTPSRTSPSGLIFP